MNVLQLIASDYKRYSNYGSNGFVIIFLTQGFWATFQYRIANFFFYKFRIPFLCALVNILMVLWRKLIEIMTGISIPASAIIGKGFYIGHFGQIIINSNAVIGDNCNISQGVTIGVSGRGDNRGIPIIKNNVYIGANCTVAGKIVIESGSILGANSFVNSDTEENAVMIGVPAIKINNNGSKEYI